MLTTSSRYMIPTVTEFSMAEATRLLLQAMFLLKAVVILVVAITGILPWEMPLLVPATNASTVPWAGTISMVRPTAVDGMPLELDVLAMVIATPTLALPPTKPAVPAVAAKALAVPLLRLHRQHLWLPPRPVQGESHRVAKRRVLSRSQPPMLLAPRNPRAAVPLTVIVLAASARATAPANKQIKIDLDNLQITEQENAREREFPP